MDSSQLMYDLPSGNSETWSFIVSELEKPLTNTEELKNCIINTRNCCFKQEEQADRITRLPSLFDAISELEEQIEDFQFFQTLLPKIKEWALDLPILFNDQNHQFPALESGKNCEVKFTGIQSRSLLANSFFCTLAPFKILKKAEGFKRIFGNIDWFRLYGTGDYVDEGRERLKCQLYYFYMVSKVEPENEIRFIRRNKHEADFPQWETCDHPLLGVSFNDEMKIEDSDSFMHADFANKDLMIHRIIPSMTQEEVLFSIRPDLFLTLLITERLEPTETVLMLGTKIYSMYTGYLHTFVWHPLDPTAMTAPTGIFAIDAIANLGQIQFLDEHIIRDVRKAFIGFDAINEFQEEYKESEYDFTKVSTGNWGCGAFGGDFYLKFLQQWVAASVANKKMDYSTFKNPNLKRELGALEIAILKRGITAGQLYCLIQRYAEGLDRRETLLLEEDFIQFMDKNLDYEVIGKK